MADELIARLRYMGRQYAAGQASRGGVQQKHYLEEAADHIAALEAKVRELESERDELLDLRKLLDDVKQGTMADERIKFVHNLITDLAASRQQVERLATLLAGIQEVYGVHMGPMTQASITEALAAVEKERHNDQGNGPRQAQLAEGPR